MNISSIQCTNCGKPVEGRYCGHCGEKVYTDHDKSFSHLFEEGFHTVTHLDGKFATTLRVLLLRPGQFAYDYCRGLRKKYYKPLGLFLMVVIVYLLFPFMQGLNLPMNGALDSFGSYSLSFTRSLAEAKAEARGYSMQELAEHYNARSPAFAKVMLFLLLPMSAFVLWLLNRRRKRYIFDHFILGTELVTHFILISFLLIPGLLFCVSAVMHSATGRAFRFDDEWLAPIILTVLMPSWTMAIKRFYSEKTGKAILKSVLFFVVFALLCLFILYRLIIFLTILLFL